MLGVFYPGQAYFGQATIPGATIPIVIPTDPLYAIDVSRQRLRNNAVSGSVSRPYVRERLILPTLTEG